MIVADGNLVLMSENGSLVLLEATADKYKELARAAMLKGPVRAHMALSNGRLYARDNKVLVCWNLKK
jgi:hypothetical protein